MKRKVLFIIMSLGVLSLIVVPGCTKYGSNPPTEHFAFTTPEVVAPLNESVVYVTGTTVDLTWTSANESGDPVKADIYFGTSDAPPLVQANHNALTYTATVEPGLTYFWHVVMRDANGITTSGPTWSFTPLCVFVPSKAVGSYHSYSAPNQWNSEGDITITASPTDQYTVSVVGIEALEGVVENRGPLVMHIDPVNYAVTAPKVVIATDAFGYHNLSYEGTGTYNACDGSYEMNFTISADEGSFGEFVFSFTRNP